MEIHQGTFNLLGCPKCKTRLNHSSDTLSCEKCDGRFSVQDNVPIFIEQEMIEKSEVAQHRAKSGSSLKSALRFLRPPHHSVYMDTLESSNNEGRTLIDFLKGFESDDYVVNIGSLSKKIEGSKVHVLNLDISHYPNIDIVADAHHLPFQDESLDGVIIKNVFEHLREPAVVRDELKRVVKKGGKIYAKVPFMQPFHAVPDDYQRYSKNGLVEFFKDFTILDKGISVGPSSALAWFLQEYFGVLFSFNTNKGYRIARALFSYITAPIKYFDVFFRNKKEAHRLASAFYVVLQK